MLEEIRKLSSWMLSEDRGCSALQHKNSLQVFSTGVMERWLRSFVRGEEKSRELWQRSLCCSWEGEKIAQRTTCAECVEPEGSGNCWLCLLSFCLFLRRLRDVFGRRAESHNKQRWKVVLWQMGLCRDRDIEGMLFEVRDVGTAGGSEVLTSAFLVILEFRLSSVVRKRGAVRLMGLGPHRGPAGI